MTQGPETGREAESFVQMTSPGPRREGAGSGKGGLAGSRAWGGGGSAGRDAPLGSAETAAPRPPAPNPGRESPSGVRPRGAGSTRLRRNRAPRRSGGSAASILLRPCILITAALIFMSRDSRGTAGCHFPRPRTPPHPFPG